MSNSEQWDHSGYQELESEDKGTTNLKRANGNKKPFYKFKEGNNINEKPNTTDYIDYSQHRKNPNKNYSSYNTNKYTGNEEYNRDKDKTTMECDINNSFKNKQKRKKKEEIYPGLGSINQQPSNTEQYYYRKSCEELGGNLDNQNSYMQVNQGGRKSKDFSSRMIGTQIPNSNYINMNPQEIDNQNLNRDNNFNNQNFNKRKTHLTPTNSEFNPGHPGHGFFNGNNMPISNISMGNQNNFQKFNNFVGGNYNFNQINPKIVQSNQQYYNSNPGKNTNPQMNQINNMNQTNVPYNTNNPKQLYSQSLPYPHPSHTHSNSNEINNPKNMHGSENNPNMENEQYFLSQQNKIINNETNKNRKNMKDIRETIKSNKNIKMPNFTNTETNDTNSHSEDNSNSVILTPQRNSMNSSQIGANTGNTHNNNFHNTSNHVLTPGNSVGYSPKNEQIFMSNILKMPNNINLNSPMRQEGFIFPNFHNNQRALNMNNQIIAMMPGVMMDGGHLLNSNMQANSFNPANFNPNYPNYSYNTRNNPVPHMMNQNKNPMSINNINPNNLSKFGSNKSVNSHDEIEGRSSLGNKYNNNNTNNNNFTANNFQYVDRNNSGVNINNNHSKSPINPNNTGYQPNLFYSNKKVNQNVNLAQNMGRNTMNKNINPFQINQNINPIMNQMINPSANNKNYANANMNMNINPPGKNFINSKFPNNSMNTQNIIGNNPTQRMKFVKSDKNLISNLQNQTDFNNQIIQNMNNSLTNNMVITNMNNLGEFSMRNPNANKNWRSPIGSHTQSQFKKNGEMEAKKLNKKLSSQSVKFSSIKEEGHVINNTINPSYNSENIHHLEDETCLSSDHSEYEVAEEEAKLENKKNNFLLSVSVRLLDREEQISISKGEDIFNVTKQFVSKHKLNLNLVKPISESILQALLSLDFILKCSLTREESQSLTAIENYYKESKKEEDADFTDMGDLSCFTDLGASQNFPHDLITLSEEEAVKLERLNVSR